MPRSEAHQRSIDRERRAHPAPPKPPNGQKAPVSWWIGVPRETFAEHVREQQQRMRPHSSIAGDRSVTY